MTIFRTRLAQCALMAAALILTYKAQADVSSEVLSGVTIEDAIATPAELGGVSVLRFRIVNFSGRRHVLQAITSESAENGALVIRRSVIGATDAAVLLIDQDEILDLKTNHLWAELRGVRARVATGDIITFELQFLDGTVRATAHVHQIEIK